MTEDELQKAATASQLLADLYRNLEFQETLGVEEIPGLTQSEVMTLARTKIPEYTLARQQAAAQHHVGAASPSPAPYAQQAPHRPTPGGPPTTVPSPGRPTPPQPTQRERRPLAEVEDRMRVLVEDIASCRKCKLCETRNKTVPGDGNLRARLMFIGEGPGADEDYQGLPFVGAAGQLLTKMIQAMGLQRQEVYIANIVKCRPPGNRNPEPIERESCMPYLREQIELISPQYIVLLGNVPRTAFLNPDVPMREQRGQFFPYENGILLMPTYHPSYLLRNPGAKRFVWDDLKGLMARMGLPLPGKG